MTEKMAAETATLPKYDDHDKHRDAYYNYRYFLPYAPKWGDEALCDRRLEQLLTFCQEARIDAVQFFVNTLPGTYLMPSRSAAEQEHWGA